LDRANEKSDYGFESSIVPDFLLVRRSGLRGSDRRCGAEPGVSLYKVTGKSLVPIEVPSLPEDQASVLSAIPDVSAEGTDPVRWEEDGSPASAFSGDGPGQERYRGTENRRCLGDS